MCKIKTNALEFSTTPDCAPFHLVTPRWPNQTGANQTLINSFWAQLLAMFARVKYLLLREKINETDGV